MARPLTSAEREEYGAKAYELAIRGTSQRRIGEILDLHHSTIGRLLKEQIAHRRLERRDSVNSLLDGYDMAIGEAWERLLSIPKHSASPGVAGLLNAINSLQRSKVDLLGLQPPKKSQSWVHHTTEKMESAIDRLPEAEQREYLKFLERICSLDEGGEHEALPQTGQDMRQIPPSRYEDS